MKSDRKNLDTMSRREQLEALRVQLTALKRAGDELTGEMRKLEVRRERVLVEWRAVLTEIAARENR